MCTVPCVRLLHAPGAAENGESRVLRWTCVAARVGCRGGFSDKCSFEWRLDKPDLFYFEYDLPPTVEGSYFTEIKTGNFHQMKKLHCARLC